MPFHNMMDEAHYDELRQQRPRLRLYSGWAQCQNLWQKRTIAGIYGQIVVTATSRRANWNEQPRKRDARTPGRRPSPWRPHGAPTSDASKTNEITPNVAHVTLVHSILRILQSQQRNRSSMGPTLRQGQGTTSATTSDTSTGTPPVKQPPVPPPVTLSINPARKQSTTLTPMQAAIKAPRETAPTTMERIQRLHRLHQWRNNGWTISLPIDDAIMVCGARFSSHTNTTTDSEHIADISSQQPPSQFTSLHPPTHSRGPPALLREDSPFQINSRFVNEFKDYLRQNRYPVHQGRGTLIQGQSVSQLVNESGSQLISWTVSLFFAVSSVIPNNQSLL